MLAEVILLQERLLHPIEGNTLSSYLTTHLTQFSQTSEVMLYLSHPGSLQSRDWNAIFESPDVSDAASIAKAGWHLDAQQTDTVIASVRAAAEDCGAHLGVLYNPIEQAKNPLIHIGEHALPERNEPEVDQRWSAGGLRLLARIMPAGPADITELRICVAGNVDSGQSPSFNAYAKVHVADSAVTDSHSCQANPH